MVHRLARQAEADLDSIADYIVRNSGSFETAERIIRSIADRFHLLAEHPYLGRARDDDLGPGRRTFPADNFVIVYRIQGNDVLILRVAHGKRDLRALMR